MKEIYLHHPYQETLIENTDIVLALGYFDGIHLGHQSVIQRAAEIAKEKNLTLALLTFNHHPSIVFHKMTCENKKRLVSEQKKKEILAKMGVEILYTVDFTSSFSKLSSKEFVEKYIKKMHAKVVVAGFDYTYGEKVEKISSMKDLAKGSFEVEVVSEFQFEGEKVSSTRIRNLLDEGEIESVNALLGHTYETIGRVVHGEARGRTLGFPTANIDFTPDVRLPKTGVYITRVKVNGKYYRGMTSIGHNDTFGDDLALTMEVYILDFDEEIYGEEVQVEWLHYIQPMIKFTTVDALVEQLNIYKEQTQDYPMDLSEVE